MEGLRQHLRWGRRTTARARIRRSHLEVTALEDRNLLFITTLTAVAHPLLLVPPNGRYVPVTVSGTITQSILDQLPGRPTVAPPPAKLAAINAANAKQPTPKAAIFQVTDQYRRDEPRGAAPLHQLTNVTFFSPVTKTSTTAYVGLVRKFSYSFTVNLQAQRSDRFPVGRHYYIDVAATDNDGGFGKTVAILVPLDVTPPAGPAAKHPATATHSTKHV